MANTYIHLPYSRSEGQLGKHNDGFWSDALKRHLQVIPEKAIAIGGIHRGLNDRNENGQLYLSREGLDYWLRTRYARNVDISQSVTELQDALSATGDFEIKKVVNGKKGKNPAWIYLID